MAAPHFMRIIPVSTVNRGDFGQIFTIFINIFIIMMNSILGFIWGLVTCSTIHHHIHVL